MPDFGFVGPSYEAPSIYQDAQECINFFPEIDPLKQQGERGVVALYPTPGLTVRTVLPNQQEVRGLHTVSGGEQLIAVCGNYVYALTANLVPTVIGQLNSSVGIVRITDNGVNVYLVDGAYRYTWRISSPSAAVFTGSISGTTLTVASMSSGTITAGQSLFGIGVTNETVITALGTGTGGAGTYTINLSQTVASSSLSSATVGAQVTASVGVNFSTVAITGVAGQFSCAAASIPLSIGQEVKISGTPTNATLSGVAITGIAGQFSCTASSTPLVVGQTLTISGTLGGTGTITGYTNPTNYYIIATNGSTTFQLSTTKGGAGVVTTAGTPTGLTYTPSEVLLTGVAITGTAGQFSCTASSTTLAIGQTLTISGTLGGTGTITGYTNPTTYYIIATNGSTTFELSTTKGGTGVVTTAGTPTGLTYKLNYIVGYTNPTTYYIIATNGSTTFTLSATLGGAAITTAAGYPSGLTYQVAPTTLVVTAVASGTLYVGQTIQGVGIPVDTIITALGTGGGGVGTYTISSSGFIASETMYALNFSVLPSTDGAFSGANTVDIIDNYFVYNNPTTQQFGASDLLSPISPPLSFSLKDGSPDDLVALIVDHREVYLMGEISSEVWTDVGAVPFPFQRIPGTSTQQGIAAPFSLSRLGNSFAYVSRNNRGQAQIMQMAGYIPQRISTHAVENTLANQYVGDAISWTYQLEGHEVYVVSFPSLELTWAYDITTTMWHKWLYTANNNTYERHRGNCCAVFQGLVLVGDYENGKLYELDKSNYTDDGQAIRRLRRAPHLVTEFQRQYFDELQIQFQPGVGTTGLSGPGGIVDLNTVFLGDTYTIESDAQLSIGVYKTYVIGTVNNVDNPITTTPQAMLRWSNDGGSTWSNEYWVGIGQLGKYRNRAIWRRLGTARDRIFEVVVTDPVKMVIISANLKVQGAEN